MENVESLISNKKVFTSGCGIEFNYSFVPAIINELYLKYVDAIKEVLRLNKELKTSLLKGKDEKLELRKEYIEVSQESKKLLDTMLDLILSKNPQTWKADNIIEFVYSNMDLTDINKLIVASVNPTEDEKKN